MTTENAPVVERALLACGAISSILYAVTDLLAGLNYKGYSFYSQAISELSAIGAPRPPWVGALFLTYVVLTVVFSAGLVMYGARKDQAIRKVGLLLLLYMIVGSGTGVSPMHVRGTGTLSSDMPHILSGLGATAVMLVTMFVGRSAFGRRFRIFSWTMLASTTLFFALTIPFIAKIAGGEPTPGIGMVERIAYYSMLMWIAGLSVLVLRRDDTRVLS
jgi:hypothetical protein